MSYGAAKTLRFCDTLHRGDTARTFLGAPVATIYERMRCAAAGELHEGDHLMYPHSVVKILLTSNYEGFPEKKWGQKIVATRTRIILVVRRY